MDSTLTLVGSIVIGSLFLLGVLTFYGDAVDYSNERTFEIFTQETTASLMEIIEHDFRRIGNGVNSPASAITSITDSTDITFLANIDDDDAIEVVRYHTGPTSDATSTPNPNDFILYREVDGANTIAEKVGVTDFSVKLLDSRGNEITDLMDVRMLDVALTVESLYPYNEEYTRAFWQRRFMPQSLYKHTMENF